MSYVSLFRRPGPRFEDEILFATLRDGRVKAMNHEGNLMIECTATLFSELWARKLLVDVRLNLPDGVQIVA